MASNWDRLDFLVVVVGVLSLIDDSLTAFRALRAIRPLRIAIRIQQVKVVLSAIIRALPGMMSAVIFCTLFWLIIAVLGMKWFSGALWSCNCAYEEACEAEGDEGCCPEAILDYLDTVTQKSECFDPPGDWSETYLEWTNLQWNFDNVFAATHTMFTVATLSGWAETMYSCIAAEGVDKQPVPYAHPEVGAYFIVSQIVCSFFTLNLIISTIIDNFNRIREEKNGSAFLTQRQLLWQKKKRLSSRIKLQVKPTPPENEWRQMVFHIVENNLFDVMITCCIVINSCFMAAEHYNMSDTLGVILWFMDLVFVLIFTLEAAMKMFAYGGYVYFADSWNQFDFVIVIAGLLSLLPNVFLGLNVFRLFRVGRLLRLINKAETLRLLFWTLIYAAPSIMNIGLLIFVIFYIYAIIGMALFGEDSCGYEDATHDRCEEDYTKIGFASFGPSLHLLFRVATEDGWTDVYATFQEWTGKRSWTVTIYFCSFFLLGTMIIVNLFIAVVLHVFESNKAEIEEMKELQPVEVWRDKWKELDPEATGQLSAEKFIETLKRAPLKAGLDNPDATDEEVAEFIYDIYLLVTHYSADRPTTCMGRLEAYLRKVICGKPYSAQSNGEGDKKTEREPGDGSWAVEYAAAVTAISLHVLTQANKLNIPIVITPQDDEKFLAEWFCEEHLKRPDLLNHLKEKRPAKELRDQPPTRLWRTETEQARDGSKRAPQLGDSEDDENAIE